MPKGKAMEVASLRLVRGTQERLRQATGMQFSTLVRYVIMELLNRVEAKQANQVNAVVAEIKDIVKEMPGDSKS